METAKPEVVEVVVEAVVEVVVEVVVVVFTKKFFNENVRKWPAHRVSMGYQPVVILYYIFIIGGS